MTDSFIDPESLNSNIFSVQAFSDEDGKNRIINSDIMSVDFDGNVPIVSETIGVDGLEAGMSFILPETDDLVTVISVSYDDPELVDSPSDDYVVSYLSDTGDIQTIILGASDEVDVFYEDASEIALGQTGWAITQGGNAVFNNITARGKIEALSGDIGGWEITPQGEFEDGSLFYDGSISLGESGEGSYLTGIYTGFGEHTDDWEAEGDIHQPSKIFMIYGPGLDPEENENKIPLWNDPKTTFYVDGHGYFSLGDKLTFDANTGDLNIGGYASEEDLEDLEESFDSFIDDLNDRISASISDLVVDFDSLSASIDFLYDAGFITNTDLVTTGRTTINGNNITTGVINANLVNVSSGLTGNRGIKINSLGLFAYNSSEQQTFNINSQTGAVTITGYATTGDLSGKIDNGGAATDVNNNVTNISGGKIRTGIIQSNSYTGVNDGTEFSSNGLSINLTTGALTAESFRIDESGNAAFRGRLEALSGYFGDQNYGILITANGTNAAIETTTLKLGSQLSGGVRYGSINFYTTAGSSLGSISSANSNKNWLLFGNGIGVGTTEDYFLLPSIGNSNRSRFIGSGFEWYNTSNVLLMSIAGGSGGLRVQNNTGGIQVSGGGDISVSSPGRFVGDGSGLTNLPGGGSTNFPVGTIVMYGGSSAPSGWVFCNGQSVPTTGTYANLFSVLGYSYGGVGSSFNIPNFTQTFPRGGANNDASRGNTGGQASFTLTESNIPQHNHGRGTLSLSGTSGGSGQLSHTGTVGSKGAHTHPLSGSTGSGGAHSHTYTAPNSPVQRASSAGTINYVPSVTSGTSTSNEPSHQHGVGTLAVTSAGDHQHAVTVDAHASHTHGAGTFEISGNTGNWGSSTPSSVNNQPPFLVVNFIIKI